MKKALKIMAILLFAAFIVLQFFRPDLNNPPIIAEQTLEAKTEVPENVSKIFERSCNDCHTNKTIYPWYAQISPSSWFLANHIKEGRRHLNFSEWETYDTSRKRRKLREVCEQIETKEMPLPSYLWVHWDAALSDEEIKIICDWTDEERSRLETLEVKEANANL